MLLLYYSSSFTSKMLLMGRALLAQLCPLNLPPLRQGQLCTLASSYMKMVLIFALASALPSVAGFGGISFASKWLGACSEQCSPCRRARRVFWQPLMGS